MQTATRTALDAVLRADASISPDDRKRYMGALKPPTTPEATGTDRIVRRAEVAQMLSRCPRSVDLLASRGILPRVSVPGVGRALGFRLSDVQALVSGRLPGQSPFC